MNFDQFLKVRPPYKFDFACFLKYKNEKLEIIVMKAVTTKIILRKQTLCLTRSLCKPTTKALSHSDKKKRMIDREI